MRAILIGGGGLTGGLLLQQLLADPVFTGIRSISRKPLGIQHPRLEEIIINFEEDTAFRNAVDFADVLFCCVGTTQKEVKGDKKAYRKVDFDIPVKAARLAAEKNMGKYLLVSAVGANSASTNFYLRLKGETESAVLSQPITSIYIMRPSILLGQRQESRPAELLGKAVMRFFSLFLFGGARRYKAISAWDVAASMIAGSKQTSPGRFICEYDNMMQLARQGK